MAGTRQKISDSDRRDEPGEKGDLKRARYSAHGEINWESRKRHETAKQSRGDERTVAGRRKRVLLRGWMNQAVDIVLDWLEKSHRLRAPSTRSPLCAEDRVRGHLSEH